MQNAYAYLHERLLQMLIRLAPKAENLVFPMKQHKRFTYYRKLVVYTAPMFITLTGKLSIDQIHVLLLKTVSRSQHVVSMELHNLLTYDISFFSKTG